MMAELPEERGIKVIALDIPESISGSKAMVQRSEMAELPAIVVNQKHTDTTRLWVGDMTYIQTWTGFLHLSVVIDVYSCKVAGWTFEACKRNRTVEAS